MSCVDLGLWYFVTKTDSGILHIAVLATIILEIIGMLFYVRLNRKISINTSERERNACASTIDYEDTFTFDAAECQTWSKKIQKANRNVILPIYSKLLWLFIAYEIIMITYSIGLLVLSTNNVAIYTVTKYLIIIAQGFCVNFFWYSFMYLILCCFVQRSSGTKSWKRSAYISLFLGTIHGVAFIFVFYRTHNEPITIYITTGLCLFDLIIFTFFIYYMCKYPRKRYRKSLIGYTSCIFIIHMVWLILNIIALHIVSNKYTPPSHSYFESIFFKNASFCVYYFYIFDALRQLLFPIILFFTLKYDSEYWSEMALSIMSTNNARLSVWDECIEYNDKELHKCSVNTSNTNVTFDEVANIAEMQIPIFDWKCLGMNEENDDSMNDSYIGTGTSATVVLGKYKGNNVAIKCILCDELDIDIMHLFYKEALLSLSLQNKGKAHPNIVRFLGIAIQPPELCLIYEYCKHKSLTNVLYNVQKYPHFNYLQILYIALDIAKGMKYLHKNNIVHRDLKTENILIHEYTANNTKYYRNKLFIAKVCDFGLARKLQNRFDDEEHQILPSPSISAISSRHSTFSSFGGYRRRARSNLQYLLDEDNIMDDDIKHYYDDSPRHRPQFMTTEVGTVAFLPPEILENISFHDGMVADVEILSKNTWYAQSVDVFSFGCILWELIMRDEVYKEYKTAQDIRNAVLKGNYPRMPQWAPDEYTNLIKMCWKKDPFERPPFDSISYNLKRMIKHIINNYKTYDCAAIDQADADCVTDDGKSIVSNNY